jgi:hypothetical protein
LFPVCDPNSSTIGEWRPIVKRYVALITVSLVLTGAAVAVAHHAAAGIVDEDIYAMIDALVADTPHGEMTLDDLGGGMTEITIGQVTLVSVERMIEDDLLTYASMLDGAVTVQITFEDPRNVEILILQEE